MNRIALLTLLLVAPSIAFAADPLCRFTESPPKIDGAGDDACWKEAVLIDSFGLPWLGEKKRPPKTATKAKLLWDRENLYFLAEMEDTDLYADVQEHDGMTWDNDVFELFFKPADDKPGYYEFQVNAAGTVMDMFLPRRGAGGFKRFIKEGDFDIEAKVKLRGSLNRWSDKDEGWTAEGRIPWRGFLKTGGRPEPSESWAFALCRYDYSVDFEGPELSNTNPKSSVGHPDFHRFEDYARIQFEGPRPVAFNPEPTATAARPFAPDGLPPLTTSRVVGSPDPPHPYRTRKAFPNLKLNHPVCLARQPGSDLFLCIVQPYGYAPTSIVRFRDTPEVSETALLLPQGQETAYDLCFHPKFADNGFVYVGSNGPSEKGEKTTRVTRYVIDRTAPYQFAPASATVILEWASDGHNGGAICFGPDGLMYVTTGDGTSDSDRNNKGQGLDHLLAKALRIDVDHPADGKHYSVPADNPFVKFPNARPETWAYGFRNPWRIHCDLPTGNLWVGNNGQDLWEQVYFVRKGDNFGWSVMEGSHPFFPLREAGPHPFAKPAAEHSHSESRSLTGGVVYRGEKLPKLRGTYLYGDHSTGKVWGLKHDGEKATFHQELVDTPFNITCFAYDTHGEVLIADHHGGGQGNFYYLEEVADAPPTSSFPRKLSETGLFASVREHRLLPGVIPYSVNAPLWSDGSHKERYLAIPSKPGRERSFDLAANRGWNLPEETVLIKSFALDREPDDSRPRRWVETRLLTKQQGEWVGYSYAWNEEQTDATLVEAAGRDADFSTSTPDGKATTQTWHYPSRTECMVCHSRAANFVLGMSLLQMNKMHDYGATFPGAQRENQLAVLERLGLLKTSYHGETTQLMREELEKQKLDKKEIDDRLAAATATRGQREAKGSTLLARRPEDYPHLVDPYDPREPVEKRARSYLHANCAICHVEAGGGNAKMELEFNTAKDKMNLLDAIPIHDRFDLPDARLVAPGHPESSVLLHRIARRGRGQMPQLATSRVDEQAVALFREWIRELGEKK